MRASLKIVEDKFEAEAIEVALAVGRKLANDLIAREPLAEVAALADQGFRELLGGPPPGGRGKGGRPSAFGSCWRRRISWCASTASCSAPPRISSPSSRARAGSRAGSW